MSGSLGGSGEFGFAIVCLYALARGRLVVATYSPDADALVLRDCYRINEFNVEDVISLMLPYHETPQFAQMLQTLKFELVFPFSSFREKLRSLNPLPNATVNPASSHP